MKTARKKFSMMMPVKLLDRLAAVAKQQSKEKVRKVSVASLVIDAVVQAYCGTGVEREGGERRCGGAPTVVSTLAPCTNATATWSSAPGAAASSSPASAPPG